MSNHQYAAKARNLLHRNPEDRSMGGRLHFASAAPGSSDPNSVSYALLEQIIDNGNKIVLTTGCAVPDKLDNLPVRLPALIVPGLQMMRAYKEQFGKDIPYHVYQAGAFISRVNNQSDEQRKETAAFMQAYLETFVQEFFPDLQDNVKFDFNKDVADENLEPIKEFLKETKDEQAQDYLAKIKEYSTFGTNRGCAYTYAAANIYFNGLCDEDAEANVTIIPIGGQKETPFFYLTSLYHSSGLSQKNVIVFPVTFNCQGIPPYFPYRKQDLTLGIALQNKEDVSEMAAALPGPAVSDFKNVLEPISATAEVLSAMMERVFVKKNNLVYQ